MFLPTEALYAEVLHAPDLIESIQQEQRVVIAGPGTFSAMLNALQMGFRTLAIQQRSTEVWHLLAQIKVDLTRYSDALKETRLHLTQAEDAVDTAVSRLKTIQRHLKDLESDQYAPSGGDSHRF